MLATGEFAVGDGAAAADDAPRSGGLHPAIWELLSLAAAAAALPAAQGVHTLAANGVGIDGAIPERLGELRTLQRLSLRGNLIRALPPSIGGLPSSKRLT